MKYALIYHIGYYFYYIFVSFSRWGVNVSKKILGCKCTFHTPSFYAPASIYSKVEWIIF